MFFQCCNELVGICVNSQVDDFETSALQHHCHQVFADVVNVALHGADNNFANRLCAGLGKQRTQDIHSGFHCVCSKKHLRHEQNAVTEIDAHDAHALNKCLLQYLVWAPLAIEQYGGAFNDLFTKTVVEVVVHLGY